MSAGAAALGQRQRGTSVAQFVERFALVGAWIALVVVFSVLKPDTFATSSNFAAILGSQAVLVVVTCALLIPLTAGDYDLSITGVLTLSQMIIGILNTRHDIPVYLCVALALLMGALVGLINGAFVVVLGIDSFIVTLGTGTFLGGVVLWISNSETFAGISSQLTRPVVVDRFLGVPLAFYYGLAVVIAVWYFLEYTSLGRQLLFVGRSRSVARLTGLRVGRLRWGALVASGVISAAAGVLYAGITGAADPVSGAEFLLPAFAAAFLGATSIVPGRFNPWGSFIAVYFLVTGITGLTLFGIESWVHDMFYGGALVFAVTISQIARHREEHQTSVPDS
ncbi:MAG: ABC-type transporter, integral rane subunit [Acidimicrobiales bacterium]|nr:ABC-type transporter, integral rane subunit [Acidimicrobiales bacterium]